MAARGRAIVDFVVGGSKFHAGETLFVHEERGETVVISKASAASPRCDAPARAVARDGPRAVLLDTFVGQDSSELSAKHGQHVTLLLPGRGHALIPDGWVLAASTAGLKSACQLREPRRSPPSSPTAHTRTHKNTHIHTRTHTYTHTHT